MLNIKDMIEKGIIHKIENKRLSHEMAETQMFKEDDKEFMKINIFLLLSIVIPLIFLYKSESLEDFVNNLDSNIIYIFIFFIIPLKCALIKETSIKNSKNLFENYKDSKIIKTIEPYKLKIEHCFIYLIVFVSTTSMIFFNEITSLSFTYLTMLIYIIVKFIMYYNYIVERFILRSKKHNKMYHLKIHNQNIENKRIEKLYSNKENMDLIVNSLSTTDYDKEELEYLHSLFKGYEFFKKEENSRIKEIEQIHLNINDTYKKAILEKKADLKIINT